MLVFCLVDLSIGVSGVLKSPTIIVLLLISPFILVNICLTDCGPSYTVGGNATIVQTLWRTVWFLKKLEIELPCDPAIPLLGIHTEETRSERDTCTPMFIAALVIIVRTWKQPRCPSAEEWIRKLWYIYAMEYY